jgi:hypothetical protein
MKVMYNTIMSNKPPSTKNIEKALGIADDISKLGNMSSDEEKKRQFEERQKKLKDIQEQMQKKRTGYEDDKAYIKDMYKELAETAMIGVRIMQEEAGMTGDYKNVESLAAAANAVKAALDGLKSVEIDEEKLRIEREKLDIRRVTANSILNKTPALGDTVNNTTVYVGSTGDLIRALKQADNDEKNKTIEATAEILDPKEEKEKDE